MSASLVGSEMCIRDSGPCALAGPRREALERQDRQLPARGAGPHGPWPVSYTHLTLPTICSV
eukprot:2058724-Alexandrium_andersonii.AAC.1